jgi:ethanolamine utilization protein EutA (predicted chaperonin)
MLRGYHYGVCDAGPKFNVLNGFEVRALIYQAVQHGGLVIPKLLAMCNSSRQVKRFHFIMAKRVWSSMAVDIPVVKNRTLTTADVREIKYTEWHSLTTANRLTVSNGVIMFTALSLQKDGVF